MRRIPNKLGNETKLKSQVTEITEIANEISQSDNLRHKLKKK